MHPELLRNFKNPLYGVKTYAPEDFHVQHLRKNKKELPSNQKQPFHEPKSQPRDKDKDNNF